MPWYRCMIRGENFPGQVIGEPGRVGFFLIRFVEAEDAASAESSALHLLRAEPKLAPPPGHTPKGDARVYFEHIEELALGAVPPVQPGFAWYRMEGADP